MLALTMVALAALTQAQDFTWSGAIPSGKRLTVKNISEDVRSQLERRVKELEKALVKEPDDALIHYNLACYQSLAKERGEALRHLQQGCQAVPGFRDEAGLSAHDRDVAVDHQAIGVVDADRAPAGLDCVFSLPHDRRDPLVGRGIGDEPREIVGRRNVFGFQPGGVGERGALETELDRL